MQSKDAPNDEIDWSLTTYDGARREQIRRAREMSLVEIVTALEEMEQLANRISKPDES